jgi:O-antigen ligase
MAASFITRNVSAARAELPRDAWACWASVLFSVFVLTLLVSIAANQLFLALASVCYFVYLLRGASEPQRNQSGPCPRPLGGEGGPAKRDRVRESPRTLKLGSKNLLRGKPSIAFPPIKLPLALFCVWTVVSVFWATTPAAGGFEIRKLTLFLIFLLTINLIVSARHLVFLLRVLFLESAVAGIVAVVQFIEQYRRVRIEHPQRIYQLMTVQRIHGFVGHWMNFGGQQMLVFGVLLALLLLASARGPGVAAAPAPSPSALGAGLPESHATAGAADVRSLPRSRGAGAIAFGWVAMLFLAVSILLNFTRGVWLGCFAGAVYLVGRWRARWLLILPVLVALTLIAGPNLLRRREESVLFHAHDRSIAERLEMWGVGLRMIERHPVVGVGPGNIPGVYDLYLPAGKLPLIGYHDHLHNDYIQFAAERGLPCLAVWLWLMGALGYSVLRLSRRLASLRWIAHGAFAAWIALLVEGCFEFNFGSTPVLMVFLFVITTPFVAGRIEQRG